MLENSLPAKVFPLLNCIFLHSRKFVPAKCTKFISIGDSMICRDISKLLYVISLAVRRVKFETI